MRLFVAIPLPDEVKQHMEALRQPIDGIRWRRPEQYHITLRFIGDVEDEQVQIIQDQLKSIRVSSFKLDLKGPGYFPENRHPRVLWIGVGKSPALMKLQEGVEQVCREAGLEPENREYKPHVTLGKVKGASRRDVLSFIDQHKQSGMSNIPVSEFVLYSSRLHSGGAIHEPLERYSL